MVASIRVIREEIERGEGSGARSTQLASQVAPELHHSMDARMYSSTWCNDLREKPRNELSNTKNECMIKCPHPNWQVRLSHTSILNPSTPDSRLLPEEWRVWIPYLGLQLLRLPTKRQVPKTPILKANESRFMRPIRLYNKQRSNCSGMQALTKAISPGLSAEKAGKTHPSPSLLWMGPSAYFESCCLGSKFIIWHRPRGLLESSWGLEKTSGHLHGCLPEACTRSPASPWKELVHMSAPQLLQLPTKRQIPRSPGSDGQQCFHTSATWG